MKCDQLYMFYRNFSLFIHVLFLLFFTLTLPLQSSAEDELVYSSRYLYSIDPVISGLPLADVVDMFVDNKNDELYLLDRSNRRMVITDTSGNFVYQFRLSDTGIDLPGSFSISDDGYMYVADGERIAVVNFKGIRIRYFDLSSIPQVEKMQIQSMELDGDKLFIGDGSGHRIIVMDRKKENFISQFQLESAGNVFLALDKDGLFVLDPGVFTVFHYDMNGKLLNQFGKVSGLPGGFSAPVDIAIYKKYGWVIVSDPNRTAVMMFNRNGDLVHEFGGMKLFKWIICTVMDDKNRIYVSDGIGKIRVFQIMEELRPKAE